MSNEKLNSLHEEYVNSTDNRLRNDVFGEIYAETKRARDINRDKVLATGCGDEADAQVVFDEVIFKMVRDRSITDFERTLNRRLKTKRIDLLRSNVRKRTRQCSFDELLEQASEGAATLNEEVLRGCSTEEIVFTKKEADQRQLIDFFVNDPAKVDTVTTLIVTEFSRHNSITALAKALGMHHEVVKRKLLALRRHYDANRFGDYHDYLAV